MVLVPLWLSSAEFGRSTSNCVDVDCGPKLGALGSAHCSGSWLIPKILPLHDVDYNCRVWSLLVERYERTFSDHPEKMDPRVPPFRVTQGYQHKHGSIGYLRLPVHGPYFIYGPLSCRFREKNGDFGRETHLTPCI